MAQNSTTSTLRDQLYQIGALPSGTEFTYTLSENDLTEAARELMASYNDILEEKISQYLGFGLEISDITVKTDDGMIAAKAQIGRGSLKVRAGITMDVTMTNDVVRVKVRSVDISLFNLDGGMVDDILREPLDRAVAMLTENITIHRLTVDDGFISLDAVRK